MLDARRTAGGFKDKALRINKHRDKPGIKRVSQFAYPFFYMPFRYAHLLLQLSTPPILRRVMASLLVLILSFGLLVSQGVAGDLEEVRTMAQSGAATLALRTIDRLQPSLMEKQESWIRWERERINIFQQQKDWHSLTLRLESFPDILPLDFIRWAKTQRANGFLALGQGKEARAVLQDLIWSSANAKPGDINKWLTLWRRLVIRSYLVDGLMHDAHTALVRFEQDYGDEDTGDVLLRGRVLLMNGRATEAADVLGKNSKHPEVGMMFLLAQLRSNARSPTKVMHAGLRQMRGKWVDESLKAQLWAVVAEAAKRSGDRLAATNAQEHILANQEKYPLPEGLFDFNANTLWNAYIDYAAYEGNKAQLLIGEDAKWFEVAKKVGEKNPIKVRAIYALLMLRGQLKENRLHAAELFLESLPKREGNDVLLRKLFLEAKHFTERDNIPDPVRHRLVDIALRNSDIDTASELMATMQEPPQEANNFMWHLRRARIFILGGSPEKGVEALDALIRRTDKLPGEDVDRLLQVMFDLQAINKHEDAYGLFSMVIEKAEDSKRQRELYFWMADSRKGQKRYDEAARLYLKSATHIDPKSMDPWAQTARYQAAESLAKAGMPGDARNLFQQLMEITEDPARRAVLKHEMQELLLVQ